MKERCDICGVVLKNRCWLYSEGRGVYLCPADEFEECLDRSLSKPERRASVSPVDPALPPREAGGRFRKREVAA